MPTGFFIQFAFIVSVINSPRRARQFATIYAASRRYGLAAVAAIASTAALPGEALAGDPQGVWLTQARDAAILLASCAGEADALTLCGRIVWLKDANDASGTPRVDTKNPDPTRRGRAICGLVVMGGLQPSGADRWDSGSVYNPQDGQIYTGDMALLAGSASALISAFPSSGRRRSGRGPSDRPPG